MWLLSQADGEGSGGGLTCTRTASISKGDSDVVFLSEPLSLRACNPAIVVSPSRVTRIDEMSWLAKPLAASGYTVLVQGYRPRAVRHQMRDVADVRNAVSYLLESGKGDPNRIAVLGHSS